MLSGIVMSYAAGRPSALLLYLPQLTCKLFIPVLTVD